MASYCEVCQGLYNGAYLYVPSCGTVTSFDGSTAQRAMYPSRQGRDGVFCNCNGRPRPRVASCPCRSSCCSATRRRDASHERNSPYRCPCQQRQRRSASLSLTPLRYTSGCSCLCANQHQTDQYENALPHTSEHICSDSGEDARDARQRREEALQSSLSPLQPTTMPEKRRSTTSFRYQQDTFSSQQRSEDYVYMQDYLQRGSDRHRGSDCSYSHPLARVVNDAAQGEDTAGDGGGLLNVTEAVRKAPQRPQQRHDAAEEPPPQTNTESLSKPSLYGAHRSEDEGRRDPAAPSHAATPSPSNDKVHDDSRAESFGQPSYRTTAPGGTSKMQRPPPSPHCGTADYLQQQSGVAAAAATVPRGSPPATRLPSSTPISSSFSSPPPSNYKTSPVPSGGSCASPRAQAREQPCSPPARPSLPPQSPRTNTRDTMADLIAKIRAEVGDDPGPWMVPAHGVPSRAAEDEEEPRSKQQRRHASKGRAGAVALSPRQPATPAEREAGLTRFPASPLPSSSRVTSSRQEDGDPLSTAAVTAQAHIRPHRADPQAKRERGEEWMIEARRRVCSAPPRWRHPQADEAHGLDRRHRTRRHHSRSSHSGQQVREEDAVHRKRYGGNVEQRSRSASVPPLSWASSSRSASVGSSTSAHLKETARRAEALLRRLGDRCGEAGDAPRAVARSEESHRGGRPGDVRDASRHRHTVLAEDLRQSSRAELQTAMQERPLDDAAPDMSDVFHEAAPPSSLSSPSSIPLVLAGPTPGGPNSAFSSPSTSTFLRKGDGPSRQHPDSVLVKQQVSSPLPPEFPSRTGASVKRGGRTSSPRDARSEVDRRHRPGEAAAPHLPEEWCATLERRVERLRQGLSAVCGVVRKDLLKVNTDVDGVREGAKAAMLSLEERLHDTLASALRPRAAPSEATIAPNSVVGWVARCTPEEQRRLAVLLLPHLQPSLAEVVHDEVQHQLARHRTEEQEKQHALEERLRAYVEETVASQQLRSSPMERGGDATVATAGGAYGSPEAFEMHIRAAARAVLAEEDDRRYSLASENERRHERRIQKVQRDGQEALSVAQAQWRMEWQSMLDREAATWMHRVQAPLQQHTDALQDIVKALTRDVTRLQEQQETLSARVSSSLREERTMRTQEHAQLADRVEQQVRQLLPREVDAACARYHALREQRVASAAAAAASVGGEVTSASAHGGAGTNAREAGAWRPAPTTSLPFASVSAEELRFSVVQPAMDHMRRLLVAHQEMINAAVEDRCCRAEHAAAGNQHVWMQNVAELRAKVAALRSDVRGAFGEISESLNVAAPAL